MSATLPVLAPVAPLAAPTTAAEVAAAWLLGFSNTATREAYGRDVREFGAFLSEVGVTDPLEAQRAHVEAFARTLELHGRSAATVARKLSALSSFYGFAVDEEVLEKTPVRVRRPRVDESQRMGLDADELRALLRLAQTERPRDRALVFVLAMNGLRISEALGADVDDLGHERGHRVLKVRRKRNKIATVPLAPVTAAAIDAMLEPELPPGSPLFATVSGRRMDRQAAGKVIKRLGRKAGLTTEISPHTLRHSFVSASLDSGATLRDVQLACGHASPATTTLYDRQRQALDGHPTYRLSAALA